MDFFENIDHRTHIITPNRRLSADLMERYALAQGTAVFPTPNILPYESWLQARYQQLCEQEGVERKISPTALQEKIILQSIIEMHTQEDPLLNIKATTQYAMDAIAILRKWQISLDNPELATHENSANLVKWAESLNEAYEQKGWIAKAAIPAEIIKHAALINCKTIFWIGFTELSPEQLTLINALKNAGIRCTELSTLDNIPSTPKKACLPDRDTEMQVMAHWAVAQSMQGNTVACIVPNLEQYRHKIDTVFYKICPTKMVYNISAGKPIMEYPMVRAAFSILELHRTEIPIASISRLLRSPFIGESELGERSLFLNRLLECKQSSLKLKELLFHLAQTENCAHFSSNLETFLKLKQLSPKTQTHAGWALHFAQALEAMGWPGERVLDSTEFQLYGRWEQALIEFSQLDFAETAITLYEAIKQLRALAIDAPFQPQQKTKADIHILGMLEAAAIHFDAIWVMGLNDKTWPATAKPNPYIPYQMQQSLGMPHADGKKELQFATALMNQLISANTNIVASYAKSEADQHFKPSPLIAELEMADINAPTLATPFKPITLERIDNTVAANINSSEKIRGGTSIIKMQALCPFQAFANIRLHATRIDTPTLGIGAMEKGNILHLALETFWKTLKTQDALIEIDKEARNELIKLSIDSGFSECLSPYFRNKNQALLGIEKKRCQKIMNDWLDIEKERPPFIILAQEQSQKLTLSGLQLSLRIDRIDQLSNGELLIIDYKTGKQKVSDWFGTRPTEPQLPLYCINTNNVGALAIGQVNKAEMGYKGVSAEVLGKTKQFSFKTVDKYLSNYSETTWQDQLHAWKTHLTTLADDFCHGKASVEPIDITACERCHLHSLCRIHEEVSP